MPKEEWEAAAARAAARSAGATPVPKSPKQALTQGSMPCRSAHIPPSSLPLIRNRKSEVRAPSRSSALIVPAIPSRKKYFEENVMKDRLTKRDFSHIRRDPYYKDLTKPEKQESLSYADHHRKEFWQTDVASVVKRDEEQRRAREKALIAVWANEEACRRHKATKIREMRYNAYVDMNERMQKVGCRNNRSGAPHINIITRQALGGDETPKDEDPIQEYLDQVSKYKANQRKLLLREKMSGARNFNILNWTENSPHPAPQEWPKKPPTPAPAPPPPPKHINTSKGALSYGRLFGPFGVIGTQ